MHGVDGRLFVAVAFGYQRIDAVVLKGGNETSKMSKVPPSVRKHECPDELLRFHLGLTRVRMFQTCRRSKAGTITNGNSKKRDAG